MVILVTAALHSFVVDPCPDHRRMTRDATQFASPDEFIPERFLEGAQDGPSSKRYDPNVFVFGFGRRCVRWCRRTAGCSHIGILSHQYRRCPGTHLADSTLWIAIACMLATLDFDKAIDASGEPIEPQPEYNNSTFRCVIDPGGDSGRKAGYEY